MFRVSNFTPLSRLAHGNTGHYVNRMIATTCAMETGSGIVDLGYGGSMSSASCDTILDGSSGADTSTDASGYTPGAGVGIGVRDPLLHQEL